MTATTTRPSYVGKLVILERIDPSKDHPDHYNGQYLIYADTSNYLYGVSLDGPYGGLSVFGASGHGRPHCFPLLGGGAYRVAAVEDPQPWMLTALDRVEEDIRQVRAGKASAQWAGSVYDVAAGRLPHLRQVLTDALASAQAVPQEDEPADWAPADDDGCCESTEPQIIRVTVPRGAQLLVSYE